MMKPGRKQRPVSVEDLLRLKRAERPAAEFWSQFDRELRAKQLAALVEKRPWWRDVSFSRVFAGFRRYPLPFGAAAALALTVVVMRNYQPSRPVGPTPVASPVVAAVAVPAEAVAASAVVASVVEPMPSAVVAEAVETSPVVADASAVASTVGSDAAPLTSLTQMIPLLGVAAGGDEPAAAPSPSARLIAENLAAQSAEAPGFSRQLLTPPRGFESRALPARNKPVEPLAQIKIPASRRSTLLASAMPVAVSGPVLNSERSARALSDERLYDSVTRVSARGAGVAVKF